MRKALAISKRRTVTPVGVDVGLTGVRAAQLRQLNGKWALTRAVRWYLRRGEEQQQGLAGIQDRFRRALRQNDFSGRALVVGLSQPDVELHPLELPEQGDGLDAGQIEAAAKWEIERLGRFQEGTIEATHWRLPPARGTQTTALGVAATSQIMCQIWDLCRTIGGDCRCIDAAVCALSRAGILLRPPKADEVWGILDVGARAVRLLLCVDEVPVLARSIEGGGRGWTETIAQTLKVSTDSAELHKCDHGIRPPGFEGCSSVGSEVTVPRQAAPHGGPLAAVGEMIFSALSTEIDRITAEIERSYEYVLQCYPGRHAADLILTGAGADLKNLDACLADRLGIKVARADAFLDAPGTLLTVSPTLSGSGPAACGRESLAAYLCAIGLALGLDGEP